MSARTGTLALGALVLALSSLLFAPSLGFPVLRWDDASLLSNPALQGLDLEHLRRMFTEYQKGFRYYPLTLVGWAINHAQGGLDPWVYRLTNIAMHGASAGLLFAVLLTLLPRASRWVCALVSLAWAMHPMRVEVVAWLTGRAHEQSTFFALLTTLLYLRSKEGLRSEGGIRHGFYAGALVAYAAALLSFPTAIMLPVLLFLLEGGRKVSERLRLLSPFAALGLACMAVAVLVRASAVVEEQLTGVAAIPSLHALARAVYQWIHYLWKPLWPVELSPVDPSLFGLSFASPRVLAALSVLFGVSALAWRKRREWPWFAAGWWAHLALLAPMLGWLEPVQFPTDRYAYFSSIAWTPALVSGLSRCLEAHWLTAAKRRFWLALSGASLLVVLGSMTLSQTQLWRDNVSFFEFITSSMGDHPYRTFDLDWRLAQSYLMAGRGEEALPLLEKTLRAFPNHPQASYGLGVYYLETQRPALAIAPLETAARVMPILTPQPLLGEAYERTGRLELALEQYRIAARGSPSFRNHAAVARVAVALGKKDEAKAAAQAALTFDPTSVEMREISSR